MSDEPPSMAADVGDWRSEFDPEARRRVLHSITETLKKAHESLSHCQELSDIAATFENKIYRESTNKDAYLKKIAQKMINLERRKLQSASALGPKQQTGHQTQPADPHSANAAPVIQASNDSVTAALSDTPVPSVTPMSGLGEPAVTGCRQPSLRQSLPVAPQSSGLLPRQKNIVSNYSLASQVQQKLEQEQSVTALLDQILSSQPANAVSTPTTSSLQSKHLTMDSITTWKQNCNSAGQQLPSPAVQPPVQLQGQSIVTPSTLQNHLLKRNSDGCGARQRPQQQMVGMNQQPVRQQMDKQIYPIPGEQPKVSSLKIGHSTARSFQQNARPTTTVSPLQSKMYDSETFRKQMILESQQQSSSFLRQETHRSPQSISALMEVNGEVDWKEEIFQKINTMKDAFFSELLELDQNFIPTMLKHEGQAPPSKEQTDAYNRRMRIKVAIKKGLSFLQAQKSSINEQLKQQLPQYQKTILYLVNQYRKRKAIMAKARAEHQSQNGHEQPQIIHFTGDDEQLTGASDQQLKQPKKELPLRNLQNIVTRTPSHQEHHQIDLLGITSPQFPIIPLRKALQSSHPNRLEERSKSPSFAKPGPVHVAPLSTVDYGTLSAFPLQDSAANSASHVPTATPLPLDDSSQGYGIAEAQVTEKPIDRLINAVLSASPAALHSSVSAIGSVVGSDDLISSWLSDGDGGDASNKMKRVVDCTPSYSAASPVLGMDGSCITFDCDPSEAESDREGGNRKRQKVQKTLRNVKRLQSFDAPLLCEIKAINNTLVDTVISIGNDKETSMISSCSSGTLIKFSYSAVSLEPSLKSLLAPSQISLVKPAKLFIPSDYPRSSPILLDDQEDDQLRRSFDRISDVVKPMFDKVLRGLQEPMSIGEMARAWDGCVRKAVMEFVHRHGGGRSVQDTASGRVASVHDKMEKQQHGSL